ncbi:uncharacterized protein isoform X2 [Choristoneura fumiferana]
MVKALADNIDALSRFKNKSEPVFLFIVEGKLTRAMFGANGIDLCRIIEEEIGLLLREKQTGVKRRKQDISEMLPEESAKIEADRKLEQESREAEERLRILTLAARKKRVAERLTPHVALLNFIMFWPHCHQAHYDLYEKWDPLNLSVGAKDEIQLTEEDAKELLYMSDVEPNEACIHALLKGEALLVLFKMMEGDFRNFVRLMRHALYEEIPVPKEDEPPEKQLPPIPAYERYATISKSAREVRRDRYNARMEKLQQEREERERLAAERARLAREAEEERLAEEKQRKDDERMARLAAGLPASPEPEPMTEEEQLQGEELEKTETEATGETAAQVEEEDLEVEEDFHSDVEIEGEEYIPPGGLFVPGFYSPSNDLAKSNALKHFYPKVVSQLTSIESEHLPPHVLVMFHIDKRHDVKEIMTLYPDEMLSVGVFVGDDIHTAEHLAYSIKQYDTLDRPRRHKDRLAIMVSRKRSLPLLQLAGLNPCYISSDVASGERDCLTLFPVGYGDDFEEEESIVEEEEKEEPPPPPEPEPDAQPAGDGEGDAPKEEDED